MKTVGLARWALVGSAGSSRRRTLVLVSKESRTLAGKVGGGGGRGHTLGRA